MLIKGFSGGLVKNLSATQETQVRSLGQKDPLEKEMATHSNILAWRTPWTESVAGYSLWGHKESDITKRQSTSVLSKENLVLFQFPQQTKLAQPYISLSWDFPP